MSHLNGTQPAQSVGSERLLPKDSTPVEAALEKLSGKLDELNGIAGHFENALGAVLVAQPPTQEKACATPCGGQTRLLSELNLRIEMAGDVVGRLRNILERVSI